MAQYNIRSPYMSKNPSTTVRTAEEIASLVKCGNCGVSTSPHSLKRKLTIAICTSCSSKSIKRTRKNSKMRNLRLPMNLPYDYEWEYHAHLLSTGLLPACLFVAPLQPCAVPLEFHANEVAKELQRWRRNDASLVLRVQETYSAGFAHMVSRLWYATPFWRKEAIRWIADIHCMKKRAERNVWIRDSP